MVSEYVYSPHVDFFIDRVDRDSGYEMASFHIHHKYEVYYEIEGSRRYFIEDAAYIVNAGCVVLIGENQIHKTASLGDTASSRIVMNFSREYLDKIMDIFPEVDFFSFLSEEHNHLLSNITVKQQRPHPGPAAAAAGPAGGNLPGIRCTAQDAAGHAFAGAQGPLPPAAGAGRREWPRQQPHCGSDPGLYPPSTTPRS